MSETPRSGMDVRRIDGTTVVASPASSRPEASRTGDERTVRADEEVDVRPPGGMPGTQRWRDRGRPDEGDREAMSTNLPTEYWTLGDADSISHPDGSYTQPREPWRLHYHSREQALAVALAELEAAQGTVMSLKGLRELNYIPSESDRRTLGPHRVESRPVEGSREVYAHDRDDCVVLHESYEVRFARDVEVTDERTIDGKTFTHRTTRVDVLVDWTTDLRGKLAPGAWRVNGPWWESLYCRVTRHELRWAPIPIMAKEDTTS